MASNQLRFEYAIVKFAKSPFTSSLKPIHYTNSMQWTSDDKLNRHLWRTFNRMMIHDLPKGNCWTCGIFHNVFACDYCNINHVCRSCKEHRIDLCPFVNDTECRYSHDLIRIADCTELYDDLLLKHLLPLYRQYYTALSKISTTAVWKELKEKRRRGQRMHTLSTIAVDFNDCFLPTNIIAFKSIDHRKMTSENKIYMNLLFGHYEPQRNREEGISYTNVNLKQFRKTYDAIVQLNLQLAIHRGRAARPMVSLDITRNRECVPFINDQEYMCQLNDKKVNYALLHYDTSDKFLLCRPILSCLQPESLLKEIFTSWLTINPRVELSKLQKQHYNSIFTLAHTLKWPNKHRNYIGWTHFSYYENLVHDVLDNLEDIRMITGAGIHYAKHTSFEDNNCVACRMYNKFLDVTVKQKINKILTTTCCYHDSRCCDLNTIFTVSHKRNHFELEWRTMFDIRSMVLHYARLTNELLDHDGLRSEYDMMPEWSDWLRNESDYLVATNEVEKLDVLHKTWSLSQEMRRKIMDKFEVNIHYYKVFEILADDFEVILSISTDEDLEMVERPNSYRWLATILPVEEDED
uniref:NS1 n=1 Tax=Avian rotavirus A TaxID=31563 RepID=A0A192GP81_9REOV|nr:NS1 [Avian rotavirus A]